MIFGYLAIGLMLPLLLAVVLVDLRELRIPNVLLLVMLFVFLIAVLPTLALDEIKQRAVIAAIVFAVGFLLFMLNLTGAGDVKAITVFVLFLHPAELSGYLILVAICGVVGLMLVRVMRKMEWVVGDGVVGEWKVWKETRHFPYGLPLATGLIMVLLLRLVTGAV